PIGSFITRARTPRFCSSWSAGAAAMSVQVEAWLDEVFAPFESLDLSDAEQRWVDLRAHFDDIAQALEVMGLGGEHLVRLQEAQQAAMEAFLTDLTAGVSSLLDDLTGGERSSVPLFDRVQAAQSEFADLAAAALSGDISAIEDLPGAAELLLELAEDFFATGGGDLESGGFASIRDFVIDLLGQVEDLDVSVLGIGGDEGGGGLTADGKPGRGDILGGLIQEPYKLQASDIIAKPIDVRELYASAAASSGFGGSQGVGAIERGLADVKTEIANVAEAVDHQTGQLVQQGERIEDLQAESVRQGSKLEARAMPSRGVAAA
ncbi:MAG: hypothetical protein AAFX50_17160, partial [Acidobacteriota bacterium]